MRTTEVKLRKEGCISDINYITIQLSLYNAYALRYFGAVAILDSAYRGGHYSKITFIARPLHITLHFLHLCTLKIGLKLHVCVLKILGLAMPMHMSTFRQDFPQLIFHQGGPCPPLKSPMLWGI